MDQVLSYTIDYLICNATLKYFRIRNELAILLDVVLALTLAIALTMQLTIKMAIPFGMLIKM